MKRITIILAILCIFTINAFSKDFPYFLNDNIEYVTEYNNLIDKSYNLYLSQGLDTEKLIKDNVPEYFQEYFIKYTEHVKHLRPILLSIAKHESSNWRAMRSYVSNRNGTYDRGPMGLNDNNIRSKHFRDKYFPKENINDPNIVYMIASINFFVELYESFEIDAIYVYNAGRYRFLTSGPPESTVKYFNKVISYTEEYNSHLDSIRSKQKNHLEKIKLQYPRLIYIVLNSKSIDINKIFIPISKIDLYNEEIVIYIETPEYTVMSYIEAFTNSFMSYDEYLAS